MYSIFYPFEQNLLYTLLAIHKNSVKIIDVTRTQIHFQRLFDRLCNQKVTLF